MNYYRWIVYGMLLKLFKNDSLVSKTAPWWWMHRGVFGYPVVNTPGSLGSLMVNAPRSFDSTVMNTPRSLDFLVYLVPALELVYKNHWCLIQQWVTTPLCIHYREVFTPKSIWHQQVFLQINFGQLSGVFIISESRLLVDEYIWELWLHSGEYSWGSRLPVVDTPGSRLWI
jgi:hypothetical protein